LQNEQVYFAQGESINIRKNARIQQFRKHGTRDLPNEGTSKATFLKNIFLRTPATGRFGNSITRRLDSPTGNIRRAG
jgi:hypothetical protein